MDPRDLRPVGSFLLFDRALSLVRSEPRRVLLPVLRGSAPLLLALLVFFVVERVEGVTDLRWLFAILFAVLVGPRAVGWAIAGRTIVHLAEGQDPSLAETRAVVARRRLLLWKAAVGTALVSMPWLFCAAFLSLAHPTLALLLLPIAGLRWVGAAPTLSTRIGLEGGPVGRAYRHAWRDLRGNRATGFFLDLLLWIATGVLYANALAFLELTALLAQSLLGVDLAFAERFLSADNVFFQVLLLGVAWLLVEPVRAAVGALLVVDGRVRNEALDLDRMIGAVEARGSARARTAAAAAVLLAISVVSGVAAAQGLPADPVARQWERRADQRPQAEPWETPPGMLLPPPAVGQPPLPLPPDIVPGPKDDVVLPVDELPPAPPTTTEQDAAARSAIQRILARREYGEAMGTREIGIGEWLRSLFEGFWGGDEEPWDPDVDWNLPAIPLPPPWVFVGAAALVLLIVVAVLFPWRRRHGEAAEEEEEAPEVDPRERAPEEIVDEAEALLRSGDVNGALRAIYLATLVALDRRRLIDFDPTLTNWQYLRHLPPGEPRTLFARLCRLFDYKWYGREAATEEDYREARRLADGLLAPPPTEGETRAAA